MDEKEKRKIFPLWLSDKEIEILKKKSKKEQRSANSFCKWRLFGE